MLTNTIKTRGMHTMLRFAPGATLDKAHRLQFQTKCNEGFDWRRQDYADNHWQFVAPQADGDQRSQLKLSLGQDVLHFEDYFPVGPPTIFHDNVRLAMECVHNVFNPRAVIATNVVIRLTVQADGGDARVFLGQHCLKLDERLQPLGRPVHGVGLKMVLPPIPKKDHPHWQADVKVESLMEDVSQLFIELDAKWAQPVQWSGDAIVERIQTAHGFVTNEVLDFLTQLGRGY